MFKVGPIFLADRINDSTKIEVQVTRSRSPGGPVLTWVKALGVLLRETQGKVLSSVRTDRKEWPLDS